MVRPPQASRDARPGRRGRRLAGGIALALLAALAGPATGQGLEELASRPVVEIRFEGLNILPEETVRYYLGIEEGMALDPDRVNRNLHALWDRDLVDGLEIEAEPADGGVRLIVRVTERPILRSIDYEGLKRVGRTDLTDRLVKEGISVREGEPISLGELHRTKAIIEEMYRERGFRFAEAELTMEEVSAGERRVLFTVDEGDKVRIADIEFQGNSVFRDRRLRWTLKNTKETGLISRMLKKDIFNPAEFEEDLDKVRDLYRGIGYKNLVIKEPEIEVRSLRPQAADPAEQKRRMFLTIPIEEHERWKLGEITIEGNEKFSDERLLRAFRRPRGGWLRSSVVEDAVEAIRETYNNTGHIFAQVETELLERGDNVADVVVHVQEGEQFRVGRIEFEGNERTRDKVLRRELRVHEGMVMSTGALKNSLFKIRQLEFFQIDEEDPVGFDVDSEEQTVDLLIKGQEGDRTELMLGAGWSELDGFFGQFSVRTRNFLGRGETLGVAYQSGRYRDVFDLSYQVPWFLDRPQSVGVQAFRNNLDYSLLVGQDLRQETQGGSLTYGRSFGLFSSVGASYSFYDSEGRRELQIADGALITLEEVRSVSAVRPIYVYDSRDSRLEPTTGMRFQAGVEYAGGVLGGSTSYLRPEVAFNLFEPISTTPLRTVFGVNVEAGMIEALEGKELFFFDRYYIGGENSIRGFRRRRLWPRRDDGSFFGDPAAPSVPLGGDKYFVSNVEYHFLLGGPFRFILFADAGNVYFDSESFDLTDLRYTAGAELRIFVPIFGAPIRFIYASNLEPLPDDSFESFAFSIGTTF